MISLKSTNATKATKSKATKSKATKSKGTKRKATTTAAAYDNARPIKAAKKCRDKKQQTAVRHTGSLAMPALNTVDPYVPSGLQPQCFQGSSTGGGANGLVFGNYDAFGHQTIIGDTNSNKMYRTQLLAQPKGTREYPAGVYLFNRWGKLGENGTHSLEGPFDSDVAVQKFEKTFKTKFKNKWEDRGNFVKKNKAYGLDQLAPPSQSAPNSSSSSTPSILPSEVGSLVDLITDQDMFKQAMQSVNIDPASLPAGMLMPEQIQAGNEALEAIEKAISGRKKASKTKLAQLSAQFYQAIPQSFGYSKPPTIETQADVDEKFDLLECMEQVTQGQQLSLSANSTDSQYASLTTDLNLVDDGSDEHDLIKTYFENTKGSGRFSGGGWGSGQYSQSGQFHLKNIFRAGRHNEEQSFAAFDHLDNRRLLWHGTNVAVVAAILKSGLRIMPHSRGRVGRGIYLADMHEKSGSYCSGSNGTVIMFLVEAPLGNVHEITQDDSSLQAPPPGYDSIRARGEKEPSEMDSVMLSIDGKNVMVPQTQATTTGIRSSFRHNEYLVYEESQHRIRYVLEFEIQ